MKEQTLIWSIVQIYVKNSQLYIDRGRETPPTVASEEGKGDTVTIQETNDRNCKK